MSYVYVHAAHHHGGALDPRDMLGDQHAFIMLGRKALFLVHMTMFGMEHHCYQLVLRALLPDEAMKAYVDHLGKRQGQPGAHWPETLFLGNSALDPVTIPELQCGLRRGFLADLYHGLPPGPHTEWPWNKHPAYRVMERVPVTIQRVVYARHFDFGFPFPEKLTYVVFGENDEAHMTNYQTKVPDFDHVLSLAERPAWLPEPKLRAAVQVTFDHPTQPVPCQDPLAQRKKWDVLYQGQGSPWPVTLGKTWWRGTAVLNGSSDPCAGNRGGHHAGHP